MKKLTPTFLAMLVAGCGGSRSLPEPPPAATPVEAAGAAIEDRDWQLVSLGGRAGLLGAGDRPATLRFDRAAGRAGGFAGCNTYSAGYTLSPESVTFTAPISTRMACDAGMDLERDLLAVLEGVLRYRAEDTTLTFLGPDGPVATFRAAR